MGKGSKRPRNNPEASSRENGEEEAAPLGHQNKGTRRKRDLVAENSGGCSKKRYCLRSGTFCGSSKLENGSNERGQKKKTVDGIGLNAENENVGCSRQASENSKKTGTVESSMCHQCQRNDKGKVVRCSRCKTKRFCIACIHKWYPQMSEDAITAACPVCLGNCNCRACLRLDARIKNLTERMRLHISKGEEVEYSKYMLQQLLPLLTRLNDEQVVEMETEARIQGLSVLELKVQRSDCPSDESVYCNNCHTSVVDFHRSCPVCSYDLCLICCREIREGHLKADEEGAVVEYINQGESYMHGGNAIKLPSGTSSNLKYSVRSTFQWKEKADGSICCPVEHINVRPKRRKNTKKQINGCVHSVLELRCMFSQNHMMELVKKAEEIAETYSVMHVAGASVKKCLCFNSAGVIDSSGSRLRKAASRQGSDDNYLYSPMAGDIQHEEFNHFQCHWIRGEPIIVSNILETGTGLSWEPSVIWRSIRQKRHTTLTGHVEAKVINCLDWCEHDISFKNFFTGYLEGLYDKYMWPKILKFNDQSQDDFLVKLLPRHYAEFICCLPFKEYTHPHTGFLNLAVQWPTVCSKPDMGPTMDIAYGMSQELGRGDSVTKLHCDIRDVVNVLTHTAEVTLTPKQLDIIKRLKKQHAEQDQRENLGICETADNTAGSNKAGGEFCGRAKDKKLCTEVEHQNRSAAVHQLIVHPDGDTDDSHLDGINLSDESVSEGGALWDVFRRQDVPKLQEYLQKHFKEFRHKYGCQIQQATHPIHDETFYLTVAHKRKLKLEYGIEPWTFVQKLGDAVFIPAGCPHQVRNLKSCIRVAVDFVSPENAGECFRLTDELRTLPQNYSAKWDKLQVKKMTVHAVSNAVKILIQNARSSCIEHAHRDKAGKRFKQRRGEKEVQNVNRQLEPPVARCSIRHGWRKGETGRQEGRGEEGEVECFVKQHSQSLVAQEWRASSDGREKGFLEEEEVQTFEEQPLLSTLEQCDFGPAWEEAGGQQLECYDETEVSAIVVHPSKSHPSQSMVGEEKQVQDVYEKPSEPTFKSCNIGHDRREDQSRGDHEERNNEEELQIVDVQQSNFSLPVQSTLEEREEEEEVEAIEERLAGTPVEEYSIGHVCIEEDAELKEGWDDDVQVVDMQPSESSCSAQPMVEQNSVLHKRKEEKTGGQLQKGNQEGNVHDNEKPSQLPVEQHSIRDVDDGGHQEGWDGEAQVFYMQSSGSSCYKHPIVERTSIGQAWRGDKVDEQPQEGSDKEDNVPIGEQPPQPDGKQCSIGHVRGEVETVGDQGGWDINVKNVSMQLLQSPCCLLPELERQSIVRACREEECERQQEEGRGGVQLIQVVEQPKQSSEPVQPTLNVGIAVQRLDDLVERFTHLEQRTEEGDREGSSEFQLLCSEFFTLSSHLGHAADASKVGIIFSRLDH